MKFSYPSISTDSTLHRMSPAFPLIARICFCFLPPPVNHLTNDHRSEQIQHDAC